MCEIVYQATCNAATYFINKGREESPMDPALYLINGGYLVRKDKGAVSPAHLDIKHRASRLRLRLRRYAL